MKLVLTITLSLLVAVQGFSQMSAEEAAEKARSMSAPGHPEAGVVIGGFSGDLDGSQTFDRRFLVTEDPACNASSLDSSNDGVSYDVYPIEVSTDGSYEFEISLNTLDDSVVFLYCDFDANSPESNLYLWDDDGGSGLASLAIANLEAGEQYQVVVTGFNNGHMGTYDMEVRGPDGSSLGAAPTVPTMGEWGVIALMLSLMIFSVVVIRQQNTAVA